MKFHDCYCECFGSYQKMAKLRLRTEVPAAAAPTGVQQQHQNDGHSRAQAESFTCNIGKISAFFPKNPKRDLFF